MKKIVDQGGGPKTLLTSQRQIEGMDTLKPAARKSLLRLLEREKAPYALYTAHQAMSRGLPTRLKELVPEAEQKEPTVLRERDGEMVNMWEERLQEDKAALGRLVGQYNSASSGAVRLCTTYVAFGFWADHPKSIFAHEEVYKGHYIVVYRCWGDGIKYPSLWIAPKNLWIAPKKPCPL